MASERLFRCKNCCSFEAQCVARSIMTSFDIVVLFEEKDSAGLLGALRNGVDGRKALIIESYCIYVFRCFGPGNESHSLRTGWRKPRLLPV